MLNARANAACTLLADGRAFIAGGTDGTTAMASAEIFDPSTNLWSSAGQMNLGRYGHTATLTPGGAVLLVGGKTAAGVTAQVEAFRPANGAFTTLGAMSSARTDYAVVVIDQHRTLIAGGSDGTSALGTIDIFDAYSNQITASGTMLTPRRSFGAASLLDGTVMFSGGFGADGSVLSSTEIYNPKTQTSTAGPNLSNPRAGHQAFALPGNGGVILFGGSDGHANVLSSTDLYQPWTGKFAPAAAMNIGRTGLATSFLGAGSLIAAGGKNGSGYVAGTETYAFATATTDKPDYYPGQVAKFSGTGWKPGETVALTVTTFGQQNAEFTTTAVADPTGKFTVSGFNIDKSHLGMKFLLNAAGSQSQAQATFTDANSTAINISNVTSSPQSYGVSIAIVGNVIDTSASPHTPDNGQVTVYDNNISITMDGIANPATCQVGPPSNCAQNISGTGTFEFVLSPVDNFGFLGPGLHNFQVAYGGGSDPLINFPTGVSWAASYSTLVPFQVTVSNTSTSMNPTVTTTIAYGSTTTLSATVTALVDPSGHAYSIPPIGSLIFEDGNTPSVNDCVGVISTTIPGSMTAGGVGTTGGATTYTCQTSQTLAPGTHNYYANYQGFSNVWNNSNTAPLYDIVTVDAVFTTTTITTSLTSPQSYPTPITVTATVNPVVGGGTPTGYVQFYSDGTDVCAGNGSPFTLGTTGGLGANQVRSCSFTLLGGSHSLTAVFTATVVFPQVTPAFSNSNSGSTPFIINPATTTSALTMSTGVAPQTEPFGTTETFTATVSCVAVGCAPPSGTVNFLDLDNSSQPINTAPVVLGASGSNGIASYTTNSLPAGNHHIQVAYTPNSLSYAGSTGPVSGSLYTVTGITPTFSINVLPSGVTAFQPLTFTVTANLFGGAAPKGSVQLVLDGTAVGGFVQLINGSATFNNTGLSQGSHTLAVNYQQLSGDVNFISASPAGLIIPPSSTPVSSTTFTVGKTATTTALTANQTSPMLYGTPITFTATVSNTVNNGTPTGTVTFTDSVLGVLTSTAALSGNVATYSPSNTAFVPGLHTVTATYGGDSNFSASPASPNFNLSVSAATTTTTVSANVSTINLGQSVTYSVYVAGAPGTAGNPSGTVQIFDNTALISSCGTLGTLTLVSTANPATASCTVPYNGNTGFGAGSHSITAAYTATGSPSSNVFANGTSNATPLTVTVNQDTMTIGPLTTTPISPVVYNMNGGTAPVLSIPFTLAGSVTPTPSQAFQIYDGVTLLGTVPGPQSSNPALFTLPASVYQTVGTHTLKAMYPTGDSNYATNSSTAITFVVNKAATTTTGTFTSAAFGTSTTMSGTVTSTAFVGTAVAPSGTLTFTYGAVSLGTCTLSGGTCSVTFQNTGLAVGTDTIAVAYSGDANYSTSTNSTQTVSITQNTVTATVTTSPSVTAALNQPVTITATFIPKNGGVGTPTGTVTFTGTISPTALGTAILNASGVASITTSAITPGSDVITATWPGDTNFSAPTAPTVGLTVSQGTTVVTLTPSPSQVPLGTGSASTVTYSYSVQGGPSNVLPTGTVTILNNGTAISNGSGTCAVTGKTLPGTGSGNTVSDSCTVVYDGSSADRGVGAHQMTASYGGNSQVTANVSGTQTVTVGSNTATISTLTTGSTLPLVWGEPTTISVTVTGLAPQTASNMLTGSVNFYDGLTLLNASPISLSASSPGNAATATLPSQTFTVGSHTITAQYTGSLSGQPAYSALTSAPLSLQVNKAATQTLISASNNTQTFGIGDTLQAAVSVTGLAAGTPTGTVSFLSNGTQFGSGTLVNGTASYTLVTALPVGGPYLNVTATYNGDSNDSTSNSSPLSPGLTVQKNNTTGTLVTTPVSNAALNQSVTLTATIVPVNSGTGVPTGIVYFTDTTNGGSIALGSATLNGQGIASISTTAILPGVRQLTALWGISPNFGDANFNYPGPLTTTLTVSQGTTVITLTPSPTNVPLGTGAGSTVTYTVSVTGGPSTTAPSGTISMQDGGSAVINDGTAGNCGLGFTLTAGSGNTSSGSCTIIYNGATADQGSGTHNIQATYTPTGNSVNIVAGGNSGLKTVTVGANTATISGITSTPATSPAPSPVWGESTTLSVTVTGIAPETSSNLLTGGVNFFDGGTLLNLVPVPLGAPGSSNAVTASLATVLSVGTHTITAQYTGNNSGSPLYNAVTSAPLSLTVNKGATTTTLVPTSTSMYYGVGDTLTATVTTNSPGIGTPAGSVTFSATANSVTTPLGTATLSGGTGSITVSLQLAPGTYSVSAVYNGNANSTTSTSTAINPFTVLRNATTGTLTTTPVGTAALNQSVTLTAQFVPVTNGQGVPTGNVVFLDTTVPATPITLGTGTLNNQGIASITTTAIQPGTRTLTAVWGPSPTFGDTNFAAPVTPPTATLTVSTGTTSITLTPSPSNVPLGTGAGSTVTYNVSVTGGPAGSALFGSITIKDSGTAVSAGSGTCSGGFNLVQGSGNTSSGSCTVIYDGTTSDRSSGIHYMTASYVPTLVGGGSTASVGIVAAASSGISTVTVGANTATIGTPQSSVPAPVWGQSTTLSVAVTGVAQWAATNQLTGSVNFLDGLTLLNATPIPLVISPANSNNGSASLSLVLPVGTHTITAVYLGNASGAALYSSATSAPLTVTVAKATTTTTLTLLTGSNPQIYGINDVLQATVSASSPAVGTPTGTVSFFANPGSVLLGTGTLAAGVATTTVGTQLTPSGSAYSVTAVYNGDTNDGTDTSNALSFSVNKNNVTATVVTSPATSASQNTNVLLTATVIPANSGAGMPTGFVTFYDGSTNLGTGLLNSNGQATFQTSTLLPGLHTIQISYPGDNNFNSLNLPINNIVTTTITISQGNTSITLVSSQNPANITQSVVYTYTVTGPANGGAPQGTVTLSDSIAGGGAITCNSSVALTTTSGTTSQGSCTVTYSPATNDAIHGAGSHPISASYTPGGPNASNWSTATSSVLTEIVGKLQPTMSAIMVTGSTGSTCALPNLCYPYGTTFSFSVTMNPPNPNPAYTAQVVFTDTIHGNTTTLGSATITQPSGTATLSGILLVGGSHNITASFPGDNNYLSDPVSQVILINPFTLTAGGNLTIAPNPINVTYGGTFPASGLVTLTVGAACGACALPTGNITLSVPAVTLGSFVLSGGATTNLVINQLPAALTAGNNQTLTINYGGDANYMQPAAPLTDVLNVAKATPNITLSTSPNPSILNQQVNMVSQVTFAVGQPTGTVSFFDGATNLTPTAPLLVAGTATYQTSTLTAGAHPITATYNGDTNFLSVSVPAGQAVSQTVQAGNTTVTLTPSTNATPLNTTVTYTVLVQGGSASNTGPVAAPVNGILLFDAVTGSAVQVANANCGTLAPIAPTPTTSAGTTCTVTYNNSDAQHSAGTHVMTVQFISSNTASWNSAGSPAVTVTVGKAPVTISQPTVTPTPGAYGTNLTYQVILTPNSVTPNYAVNTVQFYDAGTPLGSPVTPSSTTGVATYTTPTPPVGGTHTITAQFIGDANYTQSAVSANLVFTIGKTAPTVSVTSPIPATAPYVGQIGTAAIPLGPITVSVPGGNSGITPTGTVALIAGSTTLATGTLAPSNTNGTATYTFTNVQLPASLTVGTPGPNYSLYVQYSGDGNWAATQSANSTLQITKTVSPVTVSNAGPAAPAYGQSQTLLATFAPAGVPLSGTVTFTNNTAAITGCVNLPITNNVATCVTSTSTVGNLPLGSDSISVTALNDANYVLPASVTPAVFTVALDSTVTTLVSSPNPSLPGVSFTLTATITVPAPGIGGTGSLNGKVTFAWGATSNTITNILCSNVSLNGTNSGSAASCTVPANTAPFSASGAYLIQATYTPGPTDNNSASFNIITQTVSQPQPTFKSITSSTGPTATYGQTVTFTATFTVPGNTPPTGTVQFYDGSSSIGGLQTISAGPNNTYVATLTVPSGNIPILTAGNHVITATYVPGVGDSYGSDNSGTQSSPVILNLVVGQATVTAAPSISPLAEVYATQGINNAPVYAEWITYTATITPNNGNLGTPTGFAVFKDAGTQFGPLEPLVTVNGVTTVSITTSANGVPNLSTTPAGHPNITVSYLGDVNFAPATSVPFKTLIISAAPTYTALSPIPSSPQQYGSNLTLTAQVCATQVNPNAATGPLACIATPFPGFSGTMSFFDGSTLLNPGGTPVPVSSNTGIASITIPLTAVPLAGTAVGNHSITATYNGGTPTTDPNFASSTSAAASLSVVKGSTSTSLSSITANPSVVGQAVTFQAQVLAPGSFAAAPTGTVNFFDGGTLIGTATLSTVGGIATAQFTVPNSVSPLIPLTLGQHVMSVSYSGDTNYSSSATALSPACGPGVSQPCALVQTVNQATTTTTISSSQNGALTGQQVTLTATITVVPPGAGVSSGTSAGPTGTVVFTNNAAGSLTNVLGTGILTKVVVASSTLYQATLTLASIPTGNVAITASYSGDVNYAASSSSSLNQSISKNQTSMNILSNLNPSTLGQQVTFTISLGAIAPGTGIPTGNVSLFDGSNLLANLALVGGQTTYTVALPVGSHLVNVSYQGDTNFQPTSIPGINEVVNKIQSTLNLTSSVVGSAVASQVITFTAQIQPTPPVAVAYATGQVGFFMDGATQIGVASLASGVAALTTTLPAGNHQILASYMGDNNWSGAQSIYLEQVVGTANTTTQIVSSVNPSVFGQPVVVTVTVAVPYPGTVPATGTVQLYDNGNALGNPLPANNGTFTATLTSLAPGNHSIIAQFQANGSFSQSSSSALSQIVNKAPTVTTLAAFPNSSTSNEGVTLTAVLTVPSPGAGTPTGTVQFVDVTTSQVLCTPSPTLTSIGGVWEATCNTSALTQGSQTQSITATYSGDGNFATSTSNPQFQSVFGTQISVVNSAGYTSSNFSPNSFATIYGQNLAYTQLSASVTPWPTSLSGTTVLVTDSTGTARLAPLLYVSLSQINFGIPANTAYGLATVTVTNASGETASAIILITVTAPGLFSENGNGQGVAAGYLITVHADGTQSPQSPLFQFNPNLNPGQYVPIPIVWNSATDLQYLVLYGTGIRNGASNVTATINGISVPVLYSGPQPQFADEDQVNIGPIPQSLKGAGSVNIVITVNGQASNTVTVSIQ